MGPMLAGVLDFVIGVDTHRDTHTAAIVNATTGGVIEHLTFPTDTSGYRRLHAFAEQHAPGTRVWAIEGTGSYGSGLTTALLEAGERVVEIDRPSRPARRDGAKSDDLDAVRAAREALSRDHLAGPRARGDREALRVLMAARQGAVTARTKALHERFVGKRAEVFVRDVRAPQGWFRRCPSTQAAGLVCLGAVQLVVVA